MEKSLHCIYAFVDGLGVPYYVGKAKNLRRRILRHLRDIRNGSAYPKYCKARKLMAEGVELRTALLESNVPESNVDEREKWWIAYYRDQAVKLYNLTDGGEGGVNTQPGIAAKVSRARLGKKLSPETCKKISDACKGMRFTDEHKAALSAAWKPKNIPREVRVACSKGKVNIGKFILTDPDGVEHETTQGLTVFCEQHGLTAPNLHHVLSGTRNHHKGWRIRHA